MMHTDIIDDLITTNLISADLITAEVIAAGVVVVVFVFWKKISMNFLETVELPVTKTRLSDK